MEGRQFGPFETGELFGCPRDVLDLAGELIRCPTVAGRERLISEPLARELTQAGCTLSWQKVTGAGGKNLVASRGSGGPLFVTHVDVYPAYGHPDPFAFDVRDGYFIGRGAVDTKGQIAALLSGLKQTEEPVQIAFVVDEEGLGRGSEELEIPTDVTGAVVLEPTGLKLAPAEAGSIGLQLRFTGREAHGAMPWAGESAVDTAVSHYHKLKELPFTRHGHRLFSYGGWVNLGRIEGGSDTMLVPPRCIMELEVGFAPGLEADTVAQQIYESLDAAESIHMEDIWEPWETDEQEPLIRDLARAAGRIQGSEPGMWGMPSWTDGANLVRKGIPTVVFGAGDLAVAHTSEECMPLDQLGEMNRILIEFIRGGG